MDEPGKCSSCAAALPKSFDLTCTRCGWDNRVQMRKCVKCKGGAVSLHETLGYGPISGGVGVGGFILWRLFGSLLGWSAICALGSLCGLFTLATLGYKCGTCGKRAESRLLSGEEKSALRLRRLGYLIGAILLAVGAVLIYILVVGHAF
jgi:hypothetical protein